MGYKIPSITELQALLTFIEKNYSKAKSKSKLSGKSDKQRKDFLNFYSGLVNQSKHSNNPDEMRYVLMGALVAELEYIKEKDYKGCSPEPKTSWYGFFTGKGSLLYSTIKQALKINKENKLTNDIRLQALNKLYKYVQIHYSHDKLLQDEIHDHLARVKKRELDRIHGTAEGLPSLRSLEKSLEQLPDDYQAQARLHHRNSERALQLDFIRYISQSCTEHYGKNTSEFSHNFAYLQNCNVQYAIPLFILMRINSQHKVLSPEGGMLNNGSELYKNCLRILNIKHLNKIEHEKKIAWLRALSDHINVLKRQNEFPSKFEKYEKYLTNYISQQEIAKHSPKWYTLICQQLVRYGMGFAATKLTADIVLKWIGGTIASGVSGPIGIVVYLTGGTILVSQLGKLVTEKVIPKATAEAYAWALDRIGTSLTTATMDNVAYRFAVNKRGGLRELLNDPKITDEDRAAVENWIDTLLDLPEDIMTPIEKDNIRYIWDDLRAKEENTAHSENVLRISPAF